jgi:VIT1/CCC1 family predicted Fe2+/Mn2+ transporter
MRVSVATEPQVQCTAQSFVEIQPMTRRWALLVDMLEHDMTEASATDTAESARDDAFRADRKFVLQRVQPALLGLMDGAVSTLAPIFATAFAVANTAHAAMTTFLVGLAASVGAGISMGLAEALSDDGVVTGRGNPVARGGVTGVATAIGGMLHTFPFLIGNVRTALHVAYVVVVCELITIAYIRFRFMRSPLYKTIIQVIIGGAIVFAIGIGLGKLGAAN